MKKLKYHVCTFVKFDIPAWSVVIKHACHETGALLSQVLQ
jgi:hypothetical protein